MNMLGTFKRLIVYSLAAASEIVVRWVCLVIRLVSTGEQHVCEYTWTQVFTSLSDLSHDSYFMSQSASRRTSRLVVRKDPLLSGGERRG